MQKRPINHRYYIIILYLSYNKIVGIPLEYLQQFYLNKFDIDPCQNFHYL